MASLSATYVTTSMKLERQHRLTGHKYGPIQEIHLNPPEHTCSEFAVLFQDAIRCGVCKKVLIMEVVEARVA